MRCVLFDSISIQYEYRTSDPQNSYRIQASTCIHLSPHTALRPEMFVTFTEIVTGHMLNALVDCPKRMDPTYAPLRLCLEAHVAPDDDVAAEHGP